MKRSIIRPLRAAICAFAAFAAAVAAPFGACSALAETPAALLFEDNFDENSLDEGKWERCPEQERCEGMDFWDNALSYTDGNGRLVLEAQWNETEDRVRSGAVRTKNKFSAGYGYYEASMRLPKACGAWGAFWIMAGDVISVDGSSADGIEIDIIESIYNEQNKCDHALHWDGYQEEKKTDARTYERSDIYDGKFHTFAVWRSEDGYIFYVDGRETWRSPGGGVCPLDGYMILSMEAAAYAGAGTAESIAALPAKTEVDYLRVWNTNPYVSADPFKRIYDVKTSVSGGVTRVSARVSGEGERVVVIAAVYDDKNRLAGVKINRDVEAAKDGARTEFDFEVKNVKKAAAFVWSNKE